MEAGKIQNLLGGNPYPGRGIILGNSEDGAHGVVVYFIMGRSENSRNRIFVRQEDGIRTQAFNPAKLTDPSLIIYSPVRHIGRTVIVTNGGQTDTVHAFLKSGKTFEEALRTRTFEPDAPNFTPRISGLLEPGGGYRLSILKSGAGDPRTVRRFFFEYSEPRAGEGHLIHTYRGDGNPLPSFEGEPVPVRIRGDLSSFAQTVWNSLDEANRVSLFAEWIHRETGASESRIINKNI